MDLGVDRVLTSGQRPTAVEGLPLLRELIELADGRISIMPGGGVRPHNVHELLQLPIGEIHTGSRTKVPSKMKSAAAVAVGARMPRSSTSLWTRRPSGPLSRLPALT